MELGPRTLGGRSTLADPRSPKMQKKLNLALKYRKSFRPFAPSVLTEDASAWFNFENASPYTLFVADIKKDKRLDLMTKNDNPVGFDKLSVPGLLVPATTHADCSVRVQNSS